MGLGLEKSRAGTGVGVGSGTTAETRAAAAASEQKITVPGMMIEVGHFVGGWCWRIDGEAGRAFSATESRQVVSRASSCTISKASFSFLRISRYCCSGVKKKFFFGVRFGRGKREGCCMNCCGYGCGLGR